MESMTYCGATITDPHKTIEQLVYPQTLKRDEK
jgi:hypothetical protein